MFFFSLRHVSIEICMFCLKKKLQNTLSLIFWCFWFLYQVSVKVHDQNDKIRCPSSKSVDCANKAIVLHLDRALIY